MLGIEYGKPLPLSYRITYSMLAVVDCYTQVVSSITTTTATATGLDGTEILTIRLRGVQTNFIVTSEVK